MSSACCHAETLAISTTGMEREQAHELTLLRRKLSVAVVLTLLVMDATLPHMLGVHINWLPDWFTSPWTQLVLSSPVLFWCGREFFTGACRPCAATAPT